MSSFPVPPPPALPSLPNKVDIVPPPSSTFSSSTLTLTTSDGGSAPHLEDPLVAPRAQKVDPEIPAKMARNLDESLRGVSSPVPASLNNPGGHYNPGGFNIPGVSRSPWTPSLPYPNPTPNPNPHRSYYGGYGGPVEAGYGQQQHPQRIVSPSPTISQHISYPPSSSSSSLTAPLPTIPSLSSSTPTPTSDPAIKVAWSRDVLFLIERAHAIASGSPPGEPINGPVLITDTALLDLAHIAVPFILEIASLPPSPSNPYIAESIYHRASLLASGAFPEYTPKNPRSAFRDFETAARAGYGKAWFRIGRDYEGFGDTTHARECFERGVRVGVAGCMYRLGMAHLLGQLSLPPSPATALPLLHRAALASTVDTPQPSYVYALLLLGEFTQSQIDPALFPKLNLLPPSLSHLGPRGLLLEARTHLTNSAYLHFSPAQYKLGHAYEFATPPFEFDALLSVEWYSRASQQGETEADMALSKWFLCGSRVGGPNGTSPPPSSLGGFDKDEQLALIFASKAAHKGLPSAEFAMGYYHEVGIGGPISLDEALRWYALAQGHGNTDAGERLAALSQPAPQVLSRVEHDEITESKLVRSRTRAKERSEAQKPQPQGSPARRRDSRQVVDLIRKNTLGSYQQPQPGPQYPQQGAHGRYHTEHANTLPPNQVGITISRDSRSPSTGPGGGRPPPRRGPSGGVVVSGGVSTPSPPYSNSNSNPNSNSNSGTPAPAGAPPPRPTGPQTFAEMGISGAKAEDEKCVVM
ncbi:HCP-like protein [Lentinula aff. lateritia]|uniref:HCP-like protein n=1 Tax=Lentinula aff. lateritia TaxID=2804960 RepID=A0ACC1U1A8_9AGAR|nr:HCP-like protein [Lentinula aff. lateritia]